MHCYGHLQLLITMAAKTAPIVNRKLPANVDRKVLIVNCGVELARVDAELRKHSGLVEHEVQTKGYVNTRDQVQEVALVGGSSRPTAHDRSIPRGE